MELISGRNVLREALSAGAPINRVYVQEGKLHGSIIDLVEDIKRAGIDLSYSPKEDLDQMVSGLHQGIVGELDSFKTYSLKELMDEGNRFVILDEIEDPHNVGAIIRTAEAAGFDGLIIQKRRSSGITNTVHRSSAGATFHLKIAVVTNISRTITEMKENNIWVYGADGEGQTTYTQADFTGRVALVIGSEGKGMTRLVKKSCDVLVKIPMYGKMESLNASNAASILIYEVVRQNV